jgi:hypothetical protein
MLYLAMVFVGFVVALPGGWHYQDSIAAFRRTHPEKSADELPWPEHYEQLSVLQSALFAARGVPLAIAYGIAFPLMVPGAMLLDAFGKFARPHK